MKAKIKDLTISLKGEQVLSLTLSKGEDFRSQFDELNERELDVTIKRYYDKRSLRANRYCWSLINQLASKLRTSNEELYHDLLVKYGQSDIIELALNVDAHRYFEYCKELERTDREVTYLVAVGSSKYNSSEMARFIDGIVSECKKQGIQTETPDEIAKMVSLWGG